jgi:hypothetical protein
VPTQAETQTTDGNSRVIAWQQNRYDVMNASVLLRILTGNRYKMAAAGADSSVDNEVCHDITPFSGR